MRIAIIGGGVYGTAIAYFLEEFGDVDVVLYERDNISSASTGKSAGIVRQHYSHEIQIRFAKRGREILEELPERLGTDGGFHQNGYLIVAGEKNEERFRKNIELQQRVGIDVELVEPGELGEYVPGASPDGVTVGALERDAGFADPYLVATGFAQKAQELGATIRTNTPVTDIERNGDQVTDVVTPEGSDQVDFVIDAAGPWAHKVAEMVGIDIPLSRYEAKVATLESERSYTPELPTISDVDLGLYVKPEGSGNFIAGGMERGSGHSPIEDRSDLEGITNENLQRLGELIDIRLPGYSDARVVETWSEFITAPPDWHQIIGKPAPLSNFYVVAGGSGHGFKEAPGFAESISQEVLGRSSSNDLSRYRPHRFAEGRTFSGGYGDGSRS
jgi:sarcosine oxidase subunit beta